MVRDVFVLLVCSLTVFSCPVTQCVSNLDSGDCFLNSRNTYKIQPCQTGDRCSIDETSSTMLYDFSQSSYSCVPQDWIPSLKYPGELCSDDRECVSGDCSNRGTCRGLAQGQTCRAHADCSAGLVCLGHPSSFCTQQVPAGSSCQQDSECTNDSYCFNSRCTTYLSLPDGSLTKDPFLCKSGYAVGGTCGAAPKNVNAPSDPCYSDLDCKTTFPDGRMNNTYCRCGMNAQGLAYCQAVPGDPEFLAFKDGLLAVMVVNNKCHFETSFTARCPEVSADVNFQSFLDSYYIYLYRHSIVGASDCVQSIMPFAKSSSLVSMSSDMTGSTDKTVIIVVVVVVFSVILISGVVCFVCVRRCAMAERYEDSMRRRIMQQEMGEMEIRIGRVVKPASSLSHFIAAFRVDDLLLDQKDKRFVKSGIPVAVEVNQRNLDQVEHPEQLSEIPTATALIAPKPAFKLEVTSLESSDSHSPSSLFTKSKPDSAQMRGE